MTDSQDRQKDSRAPYEPPRLFDLGGGVAYAQSVCNAGGTPGAVQCTPGGTASGGACKSGGTAQGTCRAGTRAIYRCKTGSTVTPG